MSSRSDTETRRWIVENARQLPVIAGMVRRVEMDCSDVQRPQW